MPASLTQLWTTLQDPKSPLSAIVLAWTLVLAALAFLLWPRGRRLARQIYALAALSFREGVRLKVLWTVFALAQIPGLISFISDADGTHAGRARLILDTCIASGVLLGASLIVLLSALSVAREIESRIMHTIGAKPVPRWVILSGKALGFWAIDLCFLAVLMLFSAALVRMVPLRAESRAPTRLEASGTWTLLERNALTTRVFSEPDREEGKDAKDIRFLRPGRSGDWLFTPPPGANPKAQRSLMLSIASTNSYIQPNIADVRIVVAAPGKAPFFDQIETVPQGRTLNIFLDPAQTPPGQLKVTIFSPAHMPGDRMPPTTLIIARSSGIKLGVAADAFAANLAKCFLLMAIQGWVLAIIIASWSGVLSFPVTVALGVIFVLSGEMSRSVIELMKNDVSRLDELRKTGIIDAPNAESQKCAVERIQVMLALFPDFDAAGGPAAFVKGTFVSGLALAHTALWVGIVRGLGWALPGFIAFSRREVGK